MTQEAPGDGVTVASSAEAQDQPQLPSGSGLILAAACLCQALVVLDVSVVNVALPSIDVSLHFASGTLSWVVNAYTLAFGGLLLLGGRLADLIGNRRTMLAGLCLFAIASILGGLAQTPGQLIAARAAQGIAGAALAPVSLAVLLVTFPHGPTRSRAIGVWAMVAAGGSALGVLLGGLLTQVLNWRWVLFVNVPIVLAAVLVGRLSISGGGHQRGGRPDVLGAASGTVAVTALVYAMVEAAGHGWASVPTLGALAIAALAGLGFLAWESRGAAEPLVRLAIFRVRTVAVANVVVVFIGGSTVANFYFASLFLQEVWHYRPLAAGLAFLPFCFGVVAGARTSSALTTRWGQRSVMTAGLLLGAVGTFLFSLLDTGSGFWSGFLVPSLVASFGLGVCMVANTALGTQGVTPQESGMVSGLLNTSRQCGGSIALAALSTLAAAVSTRASGTPEAVAAQGYTWSFLVTAVLMAVAALVTASFAPGRRTAAVPDS